MAPGDFHTTLNRSDDGQIRLFNTQGPKRNYVRPAVDNLFETATEIFGKHTMGFILTGMGNDGSDGCHSIKTAKGGVMIQEANSCTVWGMPRAVYERGCFDNQGTLEQIGLMLGQMTMEKRHEAVS